MTSRPIYDATAFEHGFAPLAAPDEPCWRCSNGYGMTCTPCTHEIAAQAFEDRTRADLAEGAWCRETSPPSLPPRIGGAS